MSPVYNFKKYIRRNKAPFHIFFSRTVPNLEIPPSDTEIDFNQRKTNCISHKLYYTHAHANTHTHT